MADLLSIKMTDRTIEITHPGTGENIGLRCTLCSINDDRMTKIKRRITDRRLHLESRGGRFKADEIEENKNDLLVNALISWEWYEQEEVKDEKGIVITEYRERPTFDGEVPSLNPRNVLAVITALPWIGSQLNDTLGETESFFENSKPN